MGKCHTKEGRPCRNVAFGYCWQHQNQKPHYAQFQLDLGPLVVSKPWTPAAQQLGLAWIARIRNQR